MNNIEVLLVNPSTVTHVPDYARTGNIFNPEHKVQKSFNPGLLSIASFLASHGIEVKILDLLEEQDTAKLEEHLGANMPTVVGISCFSGWSYPNALKVAEVVKRYYPKTLVVAGGAHIAPLEERVFADTRNIDMLVLHEGESTTLEIVRRIEHLQPIEGMPGTISRGKDSSLAVNRQRVARININDLPLTRWDIYPGADRFIPYVEESRGCYGSGNSACTFCMSQYQYNGKINLRTPETFQRELDNAFNHFGNRNMYAILASTFGANPRYAVEMIRAMGQKQVQWTTEIRVDVPWESYLELAAQNGLSVLNASPESASPDILLRMNKTRNPERYLKKSTDLITMSAGIDDFILKLNFLFYAGETSETLKETLGYMMGLAEHIKSVSCAPLMVYPGTATERNLGAYNQRFGTSTIQDPFWSSMRIYPCHLSSSLGFSEVSAFCSVLDKMFNAPQTWGRTMSYKYGTEGNQEQTQQTLLAAKFGRRQV